MLHKLSGTDRKGNKEMIWLEHLPFKLYTPHSVVIPALCQGRIPHGVLLESSYTAQSGEIADTTHSLVALVPDPLVMVTHNLLVQTGPVDDGDIFTYVFNLSNEQLIIRKWESVSRLVRLNGSIWR